ncbi:hypothetical protein [Prosthecobacter dejongeii]|uniref:Uncharacterized protein n=1 Tax=Prosthecobacter dejongeii TaxID=48465 RepID=A0A7W8DQJ9_9BACT|nr:hypothetical protein [Prosthecobacter dejongeii]MBB5038016.1 hypothetical protein [Prosthecobacter dejongeii]
MNQAPTQSIVVHSSQNVNSIAALYEALYQDEKANISLKLPTDLKDYRLGGKGELIQFILTWADKCPDASITTHIPSREDSDQVQIQLNNLFNQEHGFVLALRLRKWGLDNARVFTDIKGGVIAEDFVNQALSQTDIITSGQPTIKNLRMFVVVDDFIEYGENILEDYTKLYLRREQTRSPMKASYSAFLEIMFKRQAIIKTQSPIPHPVALKGFIDSVARFAYELFENAGRWGTKQYGNSIRGILTHVHAREVKSTKPLYSQVGEDNPINDYLKRFQKADGYEDTAFLEITIFDNGPTLAKHFLKRAPKSISEELKATRQCLLLASGRSPKSNEGRGLYDSIKLINRCRGLIKYKGNRLSVFRDFFIDPLDDEKIAALELEPQEKRYAKMLHLLFMNDWNTRLKSPSPHPVASGSFFTIIVPVKEIVQ